MLQFLCLLTDESNHEKITYLYNHYHDEMLRFAKHRLYHMGLPNYTLDAEDAVQNAFVKITKYIHKIDFSATEKELRSYVLTIVTNETNNILNDYTVFDDLDERVHEIEDGDFFGQLRIQDRYDAVVGAIERMDEKYSIPLWCKCGQNLSVTDIADLLGIAEKTVYTRLDRGRKLLIEAISEENHG